jgi:flagellar hook-length control protein FliK
MSPNVTSALPGASANRPSSGGGGLSVAEPAPSDASRGTVEGRGFAAALEDAEVTSKDATAGTDASAAPSSTPASPTLAPAPIAAEAPAEATQGAGAALSVAVATTAAAAPSGWPPPGLSSLFPDRALFGAAPSLAPPSSAADAAAASAPSPTTTGTTTLAAPITATGEALALAAQPLGSARGRFALAAGVESLPADARGPRAPDALPPTLVAGTSPSATAALPLTATASAASAPADAMALALARQPSALRLAVADSESTDLATLTSLAESIAPERLPDGALPPSTSATTMPKLDLSQAFPAPVPLPSKQWMAEQNGGEATLRIAPDGLGPVEVRMRLDGDRVELGFSASQNDTRQALQDALPKLREMLAQQGLQLGHADVGHKHAQSSNDDARTTANGVFDDGADDAVGEASTVRGTSLVIGRGGRGVLDLYA